MADEKKPWEEFQPKPKAPWEEYGGSSVGAPATPPTPPAYDKRADLRHAMETESTPLVGPIVRGSAALLDKVGALDPLINTVNTIGRGIHGLHHPESQPGTRTAADLAEGVTGAALPFALPSMIRRPVAAAAGGLIGMGGQKLGEKVTAAAGGDPDTQRLVGDVSSAVTGPLLSRGVGAMMKAPAPMLAKSALGINGRTEAYGATPGKAILEETRGVSPATIEESARARMTDLGNQLEGRARATTTPLSLVPARERLSGISSDAAAANSRVTPREVSPMLRQLTEPQPGFTGRTEYPAGAHTPITISPGMSGDPMPLVRGRAPSQVVAPEQSATDFLGMKRQFDKDFISNWSPAANTKGQLGVARQAYGEMAREFNSKVPGAAELNQRISSLVPVAKNARLTDLNAGVGERMLNRAGRPTGGLFPLLFGLHEGGIPGAMSAIGLTEGIQAPEVKMIGARSLWGSGKGLQSKPAMIGAGLIPMGRRGLFERSNDH